MPEPTARCSSSESKRYRGRGGSFRVPHLTPFGSWLTQFVTAAARSPFAWRVSLLELLKLVPELPEADAEQLRGAGLDPAHSVQSHLHVTLLDAVQGRLQVDSLRRQLQRDILAVRRLA